MYGATPRVFHKRVTKLAKKSGPSLTILFPVYNAERWLSPSLDSMLHQSWSDFELLCLDDGSTDGSLAVLHGYAERDGRVRVFAFEHTGLVNILNEGLRLASSPLIARMDADDVAHPERFERQIQRMNQQSDLVALGSAMDWIDEDGRLLKRHTPPVGHEKVMEMMLWQTALAHPTVMMRKEAVLQAGGYRDCCAYAEDYDLWLRLSALGKLDNLGDSLLQYRVHSQSTTSRHTLEQRNSMLFAQACHFFRMKGLEEPAPSNLDEYFSLLGCQVKAEIESRMLQVRAELLGDGDECPENGRLLENICKVPRSSIIKQGICLYYLKCAYRYLRVRSLHGIVCLVKAAAIHPRTFYTMMLSQLSCK
jgi:hypothetical protein